MHEDRTFFGRGRYPDTGPLAVLARLSFLGSVFAVVVAAFLPREKVPQVLHSHYLEHFAAFYVVFLTALAAMPRARLRRVAASFLVLATVLEAPHLLTGAPPWPVIDNWVADLGGVAAAAAPVVIERFRRRFPPYGS